MSWLQTHTSPVSGVPSRRLKPRGFLLTGIMSNAEGLELPVLNHPSGAKIGIGPGLDGKGLDGARFMV